MCSKEETKAIVGYTVGGAIVGFILYESPVKNMFQSPHMAKSIIVCAGLGLAFALVTQNRRISEIRKKKDADGTETVTITGRNTTDAGEVSNAAKSVAKTLGVSMTISNMVKPIGIVVTCCLGGGIALFYIFGKK